MKKKKFYADGLHFGCTECGHCCSNPTGSVMLSEEEAAGIADLLDMDEADFLWEYTEILQNHIFLKSHDNGDCIFLENERCTVYEARPMQCSTFPFWPENLKSQYRWNLVAKECPGIGEGRIYAKKEIEKIANKMKRYEEGEPEADSG